MEVGGLVHPELFLFEEAGKRLHLAGVGEADVEEEVFEDGVGRDLVVDACVTNNPRHTGKSRAESRSLHSRIILKIVTLSAIVASGDRVLLAHRVGLLRAFGNHVDVISRILIISINTVDEKELPIRISNILNSTGVHNIELALGLAMLASELPVAR